MGLITDYLALQRKYEEQYGERTVILTEVGTFYEIYSFDPCYCNSDEAHIDAEKKVWNEKIGHAVELSVVLNCALTFQDKNKPYGIRNPHKIGFPSISYIKNRDTLLSNDYVIIRMDQQKDHSNLKSGELVPRFVAEICSPTMQIDSININKSRSNIICVYMEYQSGIVNGIPPLFENFMVITSVATVDILTGQNRISEFYSKSEDPIHAIQELYRFLITHNPQELLIHLTNLPIPYDKHSPESPNFYIKYLERVLELKRYERLTIRINNVPHDYNKVSYQTEFLNKIFTKPISKNPISSNSGLKLTIIQARNDHIIEEMGLEEMNYGRVAYIILMQHCYSHNPDIIQKLSKPDYTWLDENTHLILTHNAIVQLDLISPKYTQTRKNKDIDSLMSVLDHTQTHLGRNTLHYLLQNPMKNSEDISSYYDMVDEMKLISKDTDPLWSILNKQLKELPDIGRLQRKLQIRLLTPKEMTTLYFSYIKIIKIYVMILGLNTPTLHSQMLTKEEVTNFNSFISRFSTYIDFEALECCYIETSEETGNKWLEFERSPIKRGYYTDLDTEMKRLESSETELKQIVEHLNGFLGNAKGKKIEMKSEKKKQGAKKQDPSATVLVATIAKTSSLAFAPINTELCGTIKILPYSASDNIITSDKILELSGQIDKIKMWAREQLYAIYETILDEMTTKYNFYSSIATLIGKLDLIHSYAKVSHMYNYFRPEIVSEDSKTSYLEAKEIRHPIIERIIDGRYISNDIYLGNGNNERTNGILLFGVNQTGKSSTAKSIALIIIMAQIGCFVPAHLKYRPYSKIITRLSGSDNIFKGESSFAVEMTELRTILRQSDERTLVIGDELCRGTETHSGMALTASTILSLIEKDATFIFATHMHELINLSCISKLEPEKLKICHLSISYDDKSQILIYDRKIKDGSGLSIYGLVVARSLSLPPPFIDKANEVLKEIIGQNDDFINMKKSRYNSDVYMDCCAVCQKTRKQTELQTHHIEEQALADNRGLIGNMHKNIKNNLIVLCDACHKEQHSKDASLFVRDTNLGKLVCIDI